MKHLSHWIIFLISMFVVKTQAIGCEMPEGFHEFSTFGERTVYLSHYPMFGSIHSYQIILQANFTVNGSKVDDQFFAFRKSHPNWVISTSPIRPDGEDSYAVLPDFAKTDFQFSARIHYTDDSKTDRTLFKKVMVTVTQVVLNRLLNQPKVGAARPTSLSYFYFGDTSEAYLIHSLFWQPDFDQILQVQPVAIPADLKCKTAESPLTLEFRDRKNERKSRIKSNEARVGEICGSRQLIQAQSELYFDEMTLQH